MIKCYPALYTKWFLVLNEAAGPYISCTGGTCLLRLLIGSLSMFVCLLLFFFFFAFFLIGQMGLLACFTNKLLTFSYVGYLTFACFSAFQIVQQFPSAFEFTPLYLVRIAEQVNSQW